MDSKQIVNAIIQGQWTNDEIDTMVNAIKFSRSCLANQIKRELSIGVTVRYDSAKQGRVVEGTVTNVAQKYATVKSSSGQLWKVPMSMLEIV
jgi:hypothetical protein